MNSAIENIKAVAISILHSYINPKNEIDAKKILKKNIDSSFDKAVIEIAKCNIASTSNRKSYSNICIGPIVNN